MLESWTDDIIVPRVLCIVTLCLMIVWFWRRYSCNSFFFNYPLQWKAKCLFRQEESGSFLFCFVCQIWAVRIASQNSQLICSVHRGVRWALKLYDRDFSCLCVSIQFSMISVFKIWFLFLSSPLFGCCLWLVNKWAAIQMNQRSTSCSQLWDRFDGDKEETFTLDVA